MHIRKFQESSAPPLPQTTSLPLTRDMCSNDMGSKFARRTVNGWSYYLLDFFANCCSCWCIGLNKMHNEEWSSRLALYIHLLSFPAVSCLIFEMQRGLVEDLRKRSTTLDCIRLNLNSSVSCLVYVLQCKLVKNLSLKSLLTGNVWIKLQAINEDRQCDR